MRKRKARKSVGGAMARKRESRSDIGSAFITFGIATVELAKQCELAFRDYYHDHIKPEVIERIKNLHRMPDVDFRPPHQAPDIWVTEDDKDD